VPRVALGILRLALDAAGKPLQIARQVLKLLPGRGRDETGVNERVALLPDLGDDFASGTAARP